VAPSRSPSRVLLTVASVFAAAHRDSAIPNRPGEFANIQKYSVSRSATVRLCARSVRGDAGSERRSGSLGKAMFENRDRKGPR